MLLEDCLVLASLVVAGSPVETTTAFSQCELRRPLGDVLSVAGQLRAWKSLLEMKQGFVGLGFAGVG